MKGIGFIQRLNIPVIALLLNVTPVLLLLFGSLHQLTDNYVVFRFSFVMSIIWMATFLGGYFHLVGLALAICYLYIKRKQ